MMAVHPPEQPSLLMLDEIERGIDGGRKLPVPMLPSEIVRIETAMFFAQVSDKTVRTWVHKDGIGRQAEKHSPLQISLPALLMKVDGESTTLERLRSGDRCHPSVEFYLRRAISLMEELRRPKLKAHRPG
jgi:hypothetical protein